MTPVKCPRHADDDIHMRSIADGAFSRRRYGACPIRLAAISHYLVSTAGDTYYAAAAVMRAFTSYSGISMPAAHSWAISAHFSGRSSPALLVAENTGCRESLSARFRHLMKMHDAGARVPRQASIFDNNAFAAHRHRYAPIRYLAGFRSSSRRDGRRRIHPASGHASSPRSCGHASTPFRAITPFRYDAASITASASFRQRYDDRFFDAYAPYDDGAAWRPMAPLPCLEYCAAQARIFRWRRVQDYSRIESGDAMHRIYTHTMTRVRNAARRDVFDFIASSFRYATYSMPMR